MSEVARTCNCTPDKYEPTFYFNYRQEKEYNCSHCDLALSLSQVDRYDGSDAYNKRLAEIEEQRERRRKLQQQEGESIYDEVR